MKCEKCGAEITSEKIWFIHQQECKNVEKQQEIYAKYNVYEYQDLKKMAQEKGIKWFGVNKTNLIQDLMEWDETHGNQ